MKNYLQSYDDILTARRGVAAASPPLQSSSADSFVTNPLFGAPTIHAPAPQSAVTSALLGGGKTKRGRERDDDDDEMMDVDDQAMEDAARFEGRTNAPFR